MTRGFLSTIVRGLATWSHPWITHDVGGGDFSLSLLGGLAFLGGFAFFLTISPRAQLLGCQNRMAFPFLRSKAKRGADVSRHGWAGPAAYASPNFPMRRVETSRLCGLRLSPNESWCDVHALHRCRYLTPMIPQFDFCEGQKQRLHSVHGSHSPGVRLLYSEAAVTRRDSSEIVIRSRVTQDPTRTAHALPLRSERCSSAHAGRRYARRASIAQSETTFARNSSPRHQRPDRLPALPT